MIVDQRIDHARRARRVIGRIAIDQHVDVGIDIGEHPPHHMALALAALAAHLGAGRARDLDGAIRRIVVVDEDFGRRQRLCENRRPRSRSAASSLKHGTRTAIRNAAASSLQRSPNQACPWSRLYRNQALAGCGKAGFRGRPPRRPSVANSRVQSESMSIGIM